MIQKQAWENLALMIQCSFCRKIDFKGQSCPPLFKITQTSQAVVVMLAVVKGKASEPEAGLAAGALEAGLEAAALAGAAGLAGITALAFSSMPTTWSFEAGYRKTRGQEWRYTTAFLWSKADPCVLVLITVYITIHKFGVTKIILFKTSI